MEIIIILVLILLNGLFALAEIALIAARPARLQERVRQGQRGAKIALSLQESPNRFLSTIQVGITLVGTLAGTFGGASVAARLTALLATVEVLAPYADALGVGIVVLGITYLTLVLGELTPKRLALTNPEALAARLAPFLEGLSRLTNPIVTLLTLSTKGVLALLGVDQPDQPPVTDEEIRLLMSEGARAGIFEEVESEMVEGIFRMSDWRSRTVMTPRHEIVWLNLEGPLGKNLEKVRTTGYSRFPVCRGDLDEVVGIAYAKDILARELSGEPLDLETTLREPLYVPEFMPALEMLERFRDSRVRVALVLDEYGGVEGLITLRDLIEGIVGNLPSAGAVTSPEAVRRADGSWLVDGDYTVDKLGVLLDLRELPARGRVGYETVAGLLLALLDHIPNRGEVVTWGGWTFEVVDMDGLRIDQVLVAPQEEQGGPET